MSNFWNTLPQGFLGLSPMDGVSDHPFRYIQKKYGNPAVVYTEFTPVEGITHSAVRLLRDFMFDETQSPTLGQIYGHTPKDFQTVATVVAALGFDGVDINMGCPAKNVTHSGSGAALIRTPKLAQEIIKSVKQGVQDWVNGVELEQLGLSEEFVAKTKAMMKPNRERKNIPVSVKTRIGYEKPITQEWISTLLEMEPAAIALHGRTLNQKYMGLANWEEIAKAAELTRQTDTIIMGNGDIKSAEDGYEKIKQFGLDGVLIGRATFGNPWVFQSKTPTIEERFEVAIEHAELYEKSFSHEERYTFLPMRKHLAWYISGFDNASDLRIQAIRCNSVEELRRLLKK